MKALIATFLCSLFFVACSSIDAVSTATSTSLQESDQPNSTFPQPSTGFSGDFALSHVVAQVELGPRYPGTEGSKQIREYIEEQLISLNWLVERQVFIFNGIEIVNIIATPQKTSDSFFILGAHYDTRIYATEDISDPEAPVLGANDGGSGVAVLLELARTLDYSDLSMKPVLVFFDAEDNGGIEGWQWIIGSSYYASRLQSIPEFVVIIDMVGDSDQQIFFEANSDQNLLIDIWDIAHTLGYEDYFISEVRHSMLDDHTPFIQAGIPAVDIIDFDYQYWHTTQDTLENVSAISLERVGRTLETYFETTLIDQE